ncbi:hypothetical protein ACH5RR_020716 [Cinchona calisaya]|uniref:Copper transport protein n=1 Tax=Cinchona calisaya TaxID=153742 RepID=A0ABD2ZF87_9GENT
MISPPSTNDVQNNDQNMMMQMGQQMTLIWSKNAEILFSGWPGSRTGMYALALLFVFVLAVLVECLSNYSQSIKKDITSDNNVKDGIIQTICHGVKITLAYLIMLAIMSFNVGVLIVAVAGHIVGYLFFGTKIFNSAQPC